MNATQSYTELLGALARTADGDAYLTECVVKVAAAGKFARLDLWNILSYVEYSRPELQSRENADYMVLDRTYGAMDKAAAFCTAEFPLVLHADGHTTPSVFETDSEELADMKRADQRPVTRYYRD